MRERQAHPTKLTLRVEPWYDLRMFLRHLRVQGVKLLRDFELSFLNEDGTPRQWTVLVGRNGLCKTTVLQCIALAASGQTQANRLSETIAMSMPDKRTSLPEATIEASLGFRGDHHQAREYPDIGEQPEAPPIINSVLSLTPRDSAFTALSSYEGRTSFLLDESGESLMTEAGSRIVAQINPLDSAQRASLPHWFVGGYGVGRYLPDPRSTSRDERIRSLDRLRSLFEPRHQIIGTDFVSRFNSEEGRKFVLLLRDALVGGEILPNVSNIELRGQGGVSRSELFVDSHRFEVEMPNKSTFKIPATWLSQGYQGTIAWVADLIGQVFQEAEFECSLSDMEGIVLVDEIDLHLHPRWQRSLIRSLGKTFPKIQFVVTTHSPMVLPALSKEEIWELDQDAEGNVVAKPSLRSPERMTGTEIYEAFFDLPPWDRKIEEMLDRYGRLSLDPDRTEEEDRELDSLQQNLESEGFAPKWERVPRGSAEP